MLSSFESYNARFVDPRTIAETFVLRDKEFKVLCEQNNTLMVGPRGSGKTTLLKMLKVGAQIKWKTRRDSMALRRFTFAPIYVGADRQFDMITSSVKFIGAENKVLDLLSKCLLSSRIKFACLEAAREITDSQLSEIPSLSHQRVHLTRQQEIEISQTLSKTWSLEETVISFAETRAALQHQIAQINKLVERLKNDVGPTIAELIDYADFITHDPIYSCQAFIDAFNCAIGQPEKVWALCIDELEIMPDQLQGYLFSCLRSIDQRIILKLATSPFSKLIWDNSSTDRPMAGHDYTPVNLSFSRKKDAQKFTAKLFDTLVKTELDSKRFVRGETVLGRSPIGDLSAQQPKSNPYAPPAGEHYLRFTKLSKIDPSFKRYLDDRDINLDSIHQASESERAGQIRKHIWQVAVRLEFGPNAIFTKKDRSTGTRSPSKKRIPDIYLGYDSLLTICEGNPRTTIGLLRPMAKRFSGENDVVGFEFQAQTLQDTIAKYLSLLSTIPVKIYDDSQKNYSLIDLLDSIGQFLSAEINNEDFKQEPSLSLRMDDKIAPHIREAIGNAMNQGAFVMISDEKGLFDFGSLSGSRLRLSYMLCPRYHLPLTYGQTVNLSTALSQQANKRTNPISMRDLFDAD